MTPAGDDSDDFAGVRPEAGPAGDRLRRVGFMRASLACAAIGLLACGACVVILGSAERPVVFAALLETPVAPILFVTAWSAALAGILCHVIGSRGAGPAVHLDQWAVRANVALVVAITLLTLVMPFVISGGAD
jgi:hypothetical protein